MIPEPTRRAVLAGGAAVFATAASPSGRTASPVLHEVASSDRSWVHVACAGDGRLFVNHSRWFGPVPTAVAEVRQGSLVPYPDLAFNDAAGPAERRAVSVQSVRIDPDGRHLWIVDAGNPQLSGPVPHGAKLLKVALDSDAIVRAIPLGPDVAPAGSYLADIQIDTGRQMAVLPDLALGALAVVDLRSGRGHRVLVGHPATRAEPIDVLFDGKPWRLPDGRRPQTAVTSIALDPARESLYFKPLVGRTLYHVAWCAVLDGPTAAAASVRPAVVAHPTDAIVFGPDGRLFLTGIDRQAITSWRPGEASVRTVVQDPRLAWPVGLCFGPDGATYTTVGRINEAGSPLDRYRLYRFRP